MSGSFARLWGAMQFILSCMAIIGIGFAFVAMMKAAEWDCEQYTKVQVRWIDKESTRVQATHICTTYKQ